MSTVEQQNFVTRLRIYFDNHTLYVLSIINLICKTIVLVGILITIFSNHWAKSPIGSDVYSGYKNRCSVHMCTLNNIDPTWLVDLICLLATINLFMESINIGIIRCFHCRLIKMDTLIGLMFLLSFIITDCGIAFGIHIVSYVYQLPMGYAYNCFILAIIFSIIDWGFSLKRIISDWPKVIYLIEDELSSHSDRARSIPEHVPNSNINDDSIV